MSQFKKYLYFYFLFTFAILIFFSVLVYMVDIHAVNRHEELFNKQQLVQTILARKTIQEAIESVISTSAAIVDSGNSHAMNHVLTTNEVYHLLKSIDKSIIAAVESDPHGKIRKKICAPNYPHPLISKVVSDWVLKYGIINGDPRKPIIPPFYATKQYQFMGIVFEKENNDYFVVVIDFKPLFTRYVGSLKSGKYGSGYALDERGNILYDQETEVVGRNVFDGLHKNYPEVEALDHRILTEDTGMSSYSFTIIRGGKVYRKLIAWNTVKFYGRKVIIALSAPDTEINATLEELRNFYIMLGGLLALLLASITFRLLRKKQHLELIENEKRFRELSRATWEGILIHKNGVVYLANEQFYVIFGYKEEDNVEEQDLSLFFTSEALNYIKSKACSENLHRYETVGKRKDGSRFPLEVRVRETVYNGEQVRVITIRDITEYKSILEAVQAAEKNYKEIFNATNDAILILETRTKQCIDVNKTALEMFGYTYSEILKTKFSDLAFGEVPFSDFKNMKLHADSIEFAPRVVVWKGKRKNGSFFWCEATVRISSIGGEKRILTVIRDITSRMKYEEELRLSEQYYKSLFENTGTATVIFDEKGGIVSCNTKFEQLSGFVREEIEGRKCWSDFVQACSFSQLESKRVGNRKRGDTVAEDDYFSLRDRQGNENFVQIEVVGIPGTSDKVGSFLNITKRVKVERDLAAFNLSLERIVASRTKELAKKAADLEEANNRLTELDELKSTFVSSVSHELRTPLTSIRGFAKIIQRDFEKFFHITNNTDLKKLSRSERILDNLGIVLREGERLTRLINDMLDLNKIESGKMEWHDEWIDPQQAVQVSVDAVRGQFEEKKGVELHVEMDNSLPQLFVNQDRLQQVLINLLNNAAKFTEEGSVSLEVRRESDHLVFRVSDTGVGIPEDELVDIFRKFHKSRVPLGGPYPSRGTGLGLAICKEIISYYKGDIRVESSEGNGSTFTFRLPLNWP